MSLLLDEMQAFIHAKEIATLRSFQLKSRYVPAKVKRQVFDRDQGQCTLCGSTLLLQIDHLKQVRNCGSSEPQNICVLCRNCSLKRQGSRFNQKLNSFDCYKFYPFLNAR